MHPPDKVQEFADSLRLMAEWLDKCPRDIPLPSSAQFSVWPMPSDFSLERTLNLPGKKHKDFTGYAVALKWQFNRIAFVIYYSRGDVCERRVTGSHVVPGYVVEDRREEDVEWVCPPSLLKEE